MLCFQERRKSAKERLTLSLTDRERERESNKERARERDQQRDRQRESRAHGHIQRDERGREKKIASQGHTEKERRLCLKRVRASVRVVDTVCKRKIKNFSADRDNNVEKRETRGSQNMSSAKRVLKKPRQKSERERHGTQQGNL